MAAVLCSKPTLVESSQLSFTCSQLEHRFNFLSQIFRLRLWRVVFLHLTILVDQKFAEVPSYSCGAKLTTVGFQEVENWVCVWAIHIYFGKHFEFSAKALSKFLNRAVRVRLLATELVGRECQNLEALVCI